MIKLTKEDIDRLRGDEKEYKGILMWLSIGICMAVIFFILDVISGDAWYIKIINIILAVVTAVRVMPLLIKLMHEDRDIENNIGLIDSTVIDKDITGNDNHRIYVRVNNTYRYDPVTEGFKYHEIELENTEKATYTVESEQYKDLNIGDKLDILIGLKSKIPMEYHKPSATFS